MKYQPYPKYKDSGVDWLGDVPNHWEVKKIKYVFEIRKRIAGEVGLDVLSITQNGIKVKDIVSGEGQLSMDYSKYQIVEIGDFAMNHMDLLTGFVDVSIFHGVTSPDYRVFTLIDNNSVDRYYLYLMQMGYTNKIFYAQGQGVANIGRWRFQTESFNNFPIPFPSKVEQTAIANYLDRETTRIDTLIEEKQRFIELLKEKRQALISHAVTKGLDLNVAMKDSGVEWLGDVPQHWEVKPIKHFILKIESGTSVNAADTPATENEIGVLKTSCVYTGIFNPTENKTVIDKEIGLVTCPLKIGTLIVSRMNTPDLVGAAGLVTIAPNNIYLPDRLWQVSFSNANPVFIYYWTQSTFYRAVIKTVCTGTSSSMQNLSQEQFRGFFIVSPDYKEQTVIANYLDQQTAKIDALVSETVNSIELLKEHRSALISAAVTGKIDLRSAANASAV